MTEETKDYIQNAIICAAYAAAMMAAYRADLAIFLLEKSKWLTIKGLALHVMEEKQNAL